MYFFKMWWILKYGIHQTVNNEAEWGKVLYLSFDIFFPDTLLENQTYSNLEIMFNEVMFTTPSWLTVEFMSQTNVNCQCVEWDLRSTSPTQVPIIAGKNPQPQECKTESS